MTMQRHIEAAGRMIWSQRSLVRNLREREEGGNCCAEELVMTSCSARSMSAAVS